MVTLPRPLQDLLAAAGRTLFEQVLPIPGRVHRWLSRTEFRVRGAMLLGVTLIAACFLLLSVHVISICDLGRRTEGAAVRGALEVASRCRSAIGTLDAFEALLAAYPSTAKGTLELPVIGSLHGFAIVRAGVVTQVTGALDPTSLDAQWQSERLQDLAQKLHHHHAGAGMRTTTALLGFERLYRDAETLTRTKFDGSLVIGRAWPRGSTWDGVVVFVPVASVEQTLRLSMDDYNNGAYDYVFDDNGAFVTYPKRYHVTGTFPGGVQTRYATNEKDIGKQPLLVQNSDFITKGVAGTGNASKMYDDLLKTGWSRRTYRNLRGDYKITIGTSMVPSALGMKGDTLFVVSSQRISIPDVLIARVLIPDLVSMIPAVWEISSLFILALSGWLWYAWSLQRRHQALAAWRDHMQAGAIEASGVLDESRKGSIEWRDREAAMILLQSDPEESPSVVSELRAIDRLAVELRSAGWFTLAATLESVIVIRPPVKAPGGSEGAPWSPARFLEDLKQRHVLEAVGLARRNVAVVWETGSLTLRWDSDGDTFRRPVMMGAVADRMVALARSLRSHVTFWGALWYLVALEKDHHYQPIGELLAIESTKWRRVSL